MKHSRLISLFVMLVANLANAQTYPTKPMTWIVGYSAGGSADYAARLIGPELGKILGQSVSVDNVAGGGGLVGMNKAANAPADGHTLYYGGGELFIPPMTNPKITHDWTKLFKPVGRMLGAPLLLVTRADAPFSTLEEFTQYARKNPGKVTYGTPGIATAQHFLGEMIREKGKIPIVHIPYRGGAQIVTDLLGGTIEVAVLVGSTATPHLKNGKMKAIAIADSTRNISFPGVPTFNENKTYVGLVLSPFSGMFVPVNTPDAIVQRLDVALKSAMLTETVRTKLNEAGASIKYVPAQDMPQYMKEEASRYKRVVDSAKISVTE